MATLAKTYGVTLVPATSTYEYAGNANNQFFGGSSDRIAMLKFDAPAELGDIEYLASAVLRAQILAVDHADADNITIGLISGTWAGNTTGGYTAMRSYCNGPTVTAYLSTSTTVAEKNFEVAALLLVWAGNPSAYSGLYLRCETLSIARISASNCDVTTTVAERGAPGAPTSATLSATVAESDPTLTWAGATQGVNNNVYGYEIQYAESANGSTWGTWTYLKSVNTTALFGSTTVALPSTRGYYRKYRIKALGEWEIDSTWKETASVRKNSTPTAPTIASASPLIYESGYVELSWSGAADADNNINHYLLEYANSSDGVSFGSWLTSNASPANTSPTQDTAGSLARGQYRKYRIAAVDAFGQTSAWKETNTFRKNSLPSAPTINLPETSKTIYNSTPRFLVTTGDDVDGQGQAITASGYVASSSGGQAIGKKLILCKTVDASPGTVSVSATQADALGAASAAATKSTTYADPSFTDAALESGTTARKAAHINELRTTINTVRDYYGLSAYSWAETITAGTTPLANWATHIAELRTAIDAVVSHVNTWDSTATENKIPVPAWIAITSGQKPSAAVVEQIRAVIVTL